MKATASHVSEHEHWGLMSHKAMGKNRLMGQSIDSGRLGGSGNKDTGL